MRGRGIRTAAFFLVFVGAIGLLLNLLNLIFGWQEYVKLIDRTADSELRLATAVSCLVRLPADVLIIVGGLQASRQRAYPLAMAASIVSLIPFCGGAWLISIPIGIWCVIALSDRRTKALFR